MKAIYESIKAGYNIQTNKEDLLEYAKQDNVDLKKLKQQILDSATAVKLVIRTYKLK